MVSKVFPPFRHGGPDRLHQHSIHKSSARFFFLSGIKAIKVDTVERLFIEVQGSLQVEGIQYISSKSPVINFVVVYYKICTSGAGLTMDSKKMDRKLMTRAAAT